MAFRTKSYAEMWSQLVESRMDSLVPPRAHLSESLLKPRSETLADMTESLDLHPLLIEYFDVTLNACDVYESLLLAVHRDRADFQKVMDAGLLGEEGLENHAEKMCRKMRGELLVYSKLENPLSVIGMDEFKDLHDGYAVLLHNLLFQHHRMSRRTKLLKVFTKIAECIRIGFRSSKIMCYHSHDSVRDNRDPPNMRLPPSSSSWGEQLDVAAKVLYIQINDMDTVSRLVQKLQDDIVHGKSRAAIAVGCIAGDLWKAILKGLSDHGHCFMEQLDELEERICLCLLTINKSRMSVVHEIMSNKEQK